MVGSDSPILVLGTRVRRVGDGGLRPCPVHGSRGRERSVTVHLSRAPGREVTRRDGDAGRRRDVRGLHHRALERHLRTGGCGADNLGGGPCRREYRGGGDGHPRHRTTAAGGVAAGTPASTVVALVDDADAATDRAVLEVLYHATGGPDWTNDTNWLSDAPLDQWYGVSTDSSGRVRWLYLAGNDLTGAIPAELGLLSNLEGLYLAENDLTGAIPAELGLLSNLEGWALRKRVDGSHSRRIGLHFEVRQGAIPAELGSTSRFDKEPFPPNWAPCRTSKC